MKLWAMAAVLRASANRLRRGPRSSAITTLAASTTGGRGGGGRWQAACGRRSLRAFGFLVVIPAEGDGEDQQTGLMARGGTIISGFAGFIGVAERRALIGNTRGALKKPPHNAVAERAQRDHKSMPGRNRAQLESPNIFVGLRSIV